MATGYSQVWEKQGTFKASLRLLYRTTYDPATNTSLVTVTPQFMCSANYGNDYRMYSDGVSGAGVYGNGSLLYGVGSNYGAGNRLTCGSATNSWADMSAAVGSIARFSVGHDANGYARFTLGILGSMKATYPSAAQGPVVSPVGATAGNVITIHESAPYSISYDANGGSGAPESQMVYAGVSYELSRLAPKRVGYSFLGWSEDPNAAAASWQSGQSVTARGNLALYAVWQVNSFTLTMLEGQGSEITVERDGEVIGNGASILYGDELSIRFDVQNGYELTAHTVNGESFASGGTLTVTGSVTVSSSAERKRFSLTIQQGDGTQISVLRDGSALGNGASILYGDELTIRFDAQNGYELTAHTVNGESFESGGTLTVTEAVCAAAAAEPNAFTLLIETSSGGSAAVRRTASRKSGAALGNLTTGSTIYFEDTLEISISITSGYLLKSATLNGGEIRSPATVEGNTTVALRTIPAGVYIPVDGNREIFQIMVDTGSKWLVLIPMIEDGQAWQLY